MTYYCVLTILSIIIVSIIIHKDDYVYDYMTTTYALMILITTYLLMILFAFCYCYLYYDYDLDSYDSDFFGPFAVCSGVQVPGGGSR